MYRLLACAICLLGLSTSDADAADVFRTERSLAARLEARAQAALDRVLGPGEAVVLVRAEVDASQAETIRAGAGPTAVRSVRRMEMSGPAGRMEAAAVHHAVSRQVKRTLRMQPRIRRLWVVLLVNRQTPYRSAAQAVKAAAGMSARRGDTLTVVSID